ncbi:ATP-binding protein [Roseateles cellulosilyticus]|uniref:AAA family ATPase n=1 Tax=Pelomonas cellulosilytica TaxID=2906762 RepID=A0ABS8XUZ2_9BURK|nr:adenylate/guanylate cyclase domain-containing protein [Pelomonas sp. P8]MCE4555500.1 AAA family ATPase [Pelomonas sp. P8]
MTASPVSAATPDTAGAGQRRLLTLLFADLSGSTAMAEWMEAEHYAAMLAALREVHERIVPHHGGVIARIQGDGMLAVFGHPEVREDDGRRATEAALELHAAVRRLVPPGPKPSGFRGLTLHSGIHAGIVLINDGDQMRGRFELLGNAPNIAARLAEAAKADEIIASEESLGLQSQFFDTGPRLTLQLRGRATPLAAYRVLGRAAVGRRFDASVRRGLTPFVGREAELAQLQAALGGALSGQTLWLGVRAGAGVGKTRLAEEFLRHAAELAAHAGQPCHIHRGYCESYLSAEPLQPFLQMLRALDGMGDPPAELAAAQHSAPGDRADALLALMTALARRAPQLVFIDDLQWADDASMRLLHRLRATAARQSLPLLLLSASRPATARLAAHDEGAHIIDLPPLAEREAAHAVQQLLPQGDPFVAAEVQRHAGGNPLFIEELCHAAAETPDGLVQGQSSSAWLAALVESRVGRLLPEQAALVRVAAVIGNVIPAWLLEALSGCGEQHPAVRALAVQDFIFPDQLPGQLRFKHGITRDVVYEATGLHERQALHRRIRIELTARGGTESQLHEQLAYHAAAANDWAAAALHAEAAGDQALAVSALDRAKKQFRAALAALEFLETPDESEEATRLRHRRWVGIAQRLGMACVFDASQDDLRVLRHAAALAEADGDPGLIARTEYWLAYVGYALGETRVSLRHARSAVAKAEQCGDQALLAQLPGTVGQLQAAAAHYADALPMLDLAIGRQRSRASKSAINRIGLGFSLCCRAYVRGDQGHFDEAHALFAEALAPFAGSGHAVEASIQGWRAAVLLWQGRWAEAREAADVAHRVGAQVRSMFTCAMGHAAAAYGAWMQSADPGAAQRILDATAWLAPRGGGLYSSFNHGWLADIYAVQGHARAARHHIALALQRGRQHDWIGGAMAYRAAARLAACAGDATQARRYVALARRVADRRDSAHEAAVTTLLAAELKLDAGWPDALDRARAELTRLGMAGFLQRPHHRC